jgi:hypothetical protein
MSETHDDDVEIEQVANGQDEAVTDEDIRALLATAKREKAQITTQLEQERSARTRAETQAHTATTGRFDAEEAAVKTRIEAADSAALAMRAKYAEALSEGRFEDAAQVQDEMAELRAKQGQDRQYQAWLASEKDRITRAPPAQQDQGLNLANYTPGQRKWIKANPEFMTDVKLRQKTEALHQLAVSDGVEIDSPEYFEIIDQAVKPRGRAAPVADPEDEDEDPPPQPRRRAQPTTDMPVTRRTDATGQPARNKTVRLSPEEREVADFTMPDLPQQGFMKDGVWQPSRYEKYLINAAKLKARG